MTIWWVRRPQASVLLRLLPVDAAPAASDTQAGRLSPPAAAAEGQAPAGARAAFKSGEGLLHSGEPGQGGTQMRLALVLPLEYDGGGGGGGGRTSGEITGGGSGSVAAAAVGWCQCLLLLSGMGGGGGPSAAGDLAGR